MDAFGERLSATVLSGTAGARHVDPGGKRHPRDPHQAPAHPLLYLLSFPSFLNLATSPADHRPLTSPHVTSETFVCLPQLEDVPDSTWCWDWEAAAWWCAGGKCNTDKPNQTNLGGFRNAWQDDKQLQPIPHRNDKADQNWN